MLTTRTHTNKSNRRDGWETHTFTTEIFALFDDGHTHARTRHVTETVNYRSAATYYFSKVSFVFISSPNDIPKKSSARQIRVRSINYASLVFVLPIYGRQVNHGRTQSVWRRDFVCVCRATEIYSRMKFARGVNNVDNVW